MQKNQEETKEIMENMQRSQEETKKIMENMQRSQEETKKIKENMQRSQEETQERIEKGLENVQKYQDLKNSPEKKIDSVEENIALKVEEKVGAEEKMVKKMEEEIERIKGWTEGVKACQLAASLRGEADEVLQILPGTERLNLNFLYNALDLRFGQK
ncbi:hypothetical protein TNCV_1401381 [Trichonephila clavipes]|nr:hypothetical protein TNCV_1401381 [Trichonephila clavipes]